jgi:hypothetical protein
MPRTRMLGKTRPARHSGMTGRRHTAPAVDARSPHLSPGAPLALRAGYGGGGVFPRASGGNPQPHQHGSPIGSLDARRAACTRAHLHPLPLRFASGTSCVPIGPCGAVRVNQNGNSLSAGATGLLRNAPTLKWASHWTRAESKSAERSECKCQCRCQANHCTLK